MGWCAYFIPFMFVYTPALVMNDTWIGPGAVLELDRKVGEAIDIYVNNRLVARVEVVLVEDKLGVTMTEIIKAEQN